MARPGPRPTLRRYKRFKESIDYKPKKREERLNALLAKRQKLEMLEALIIEHERQLKPDLETIRDMKKRANEVRAQLRVISTVDPEEQDTLLELYK